MRTLAFVCLFPFLGCAVARTAADVAAGRAAAQMVGSAFAGAAAPGTAGATSGARAPGEDAHGFVADDYFVSESKYESGIQFLHAIAKGITAPSAATQGEAEFLLIDGRKIWTPYFYRTRVATPADLQLGAVVIFPRKWGHSNAWVATASRDEARRTEWAMGTITDLSDLFKNQVTVGGENVDMGAIRVIVP